MSVLESNPSSTLRHSNHSLFFLHGRFGQAEMWKPIFEDLAGQFRCVAIDFPGFGRSFSSRGRAFSLLEHASLIHEVIRKLTHLEEKVVLIGHDVGGGVAQLCTIKSPEKVAALVLINSAGLTRALVQISTRLHGLFARVKLRKLLKQAHTMEEDTKTILSHPWRMYSTRDSLLKSFQALDDSWPWHYERQVWKNALQKVDQPVLLLWGKNDTINPPEMAAELMQRLPESYFFLHEECGHWPCLEQPEWVLSKMKEFIFKAEFRFQSAGLKTGTPSTGIKKSL